MSLTRAMWAVAMGVGLGCGQAQLALTEELSSIDRPSEAGGETAFLALDAGVGGAQSGVSSAPRP
jgi:hypothetical protein